MRSTSPSTPTASARSTGPRKACCVVADLHLEKGSSFARRGTLLPPYDTTETLARLARLIAHYAPRLVIALGDSFHDRGGHARLSAVDRSALTALQRGRDWIWITGNHDPDPADGIGGSFGATLTIGPGTSIPPRALARRAGRDRRPSASGGAHRAARPRGDPAAALRPTARRS